MTLRSLVFDTTEWTGDVRIVECIEEGTRLTLRHEGFSSREACMNTSIGWETSLERLAEYLTPSQP